MRRLSELVTGLAAHPLLLDAREHDRLVAGISHLQFILSAALVRILGQDEQWPLMKALAAGGYRDMSRLAVGNTTLHRDICLMNKQAIVEWIDTLVMQLVDLRALLVTGDETLENYFAQAKYVRDGVCG